RLKLFKKNGVTASFANPRWERDIKKTVNEMLQRQGMRMAPDALSCFVETVGGNTGLIANELEKLSLYCAGQKTVTRDAVVQVLADGHTATIFNLVDSIGMGRRADALRYVNLLCGEGVHALVIIKMAARQLRMLVRALEGLQRRDKPAVIGKQLGLKSEFVVQGILKQARGWSGPGLARAFDALCQADGSVKSSRIGHAIILENLILTLMRLRNQPAA
ncbi:MAG: DNA polymerase III subunit delta, partial [Deltaproteobacteria bacterium]|nr:DNA polymerase III subunit delta [Deltaproteobacteria bacterium]